MRFEFEGTPEEYQFLFGTAPAPVTFPEPNGESISLPGEPAYENVEPPEPKKKKKADWVAEGIAKIDELVEAGKTDVVIETLAHFGAKQVHDIKVAEFPEFMEKLNG